MSAATFTHDGAGTPASAWTEHRGGPEPRSLNDFLDGFIDGFLDKGCRIVVVAAHPDDETLGAGGLIAAARAAGVAVDVVILTDGEGSHPRSPTHSSQRLAAVRRAEAGLAATALGVVDAPTLVGLPDGGLTERSGDVVQLLVELLGDARDVLLVAPWRHDGHPDHDATGAAAAAAAVRTGARLVEYPVWFWHRAEPDAAPWSEMVALAVGPGARARKAAAIGAHTSQVTPLSDQAGDEVLLDAGLLAHFRGAVELYVCEGAVDPALDDLHLESEDPWGVERDWYERRKRALTLAALPRDRFVRALEVGCSRGALATDLASRCDQVVAVDRSPRAVALARSAVPASVAVHLLDVPHEWPEGVFDLVVLSEVGYFLSPVDLDRLLERLAGSLAGDGVVVLCHWRHPIAGWVLDAAAVHERALRTGLSGQQTPLPPLMARYTDDDVELLVLAAAADRPTARG